MFASALVLQYKHLQLFLLEALLCRWFSGALRPVVVSSEEIQQVQPAVHLDAQPSIVSELPSPVPWWARVGLSVLVLALPLICIVTIILRIAFRSQPPRVKYAWVSFLATLLVRRKNLDRLDFQTA